MENKIICITPLFERAEEYGKTTFELIKLKAVERTANVISTLASRGIVFLLLAMFISLVSVGAALWVGDLLGKSYYGFFCIAGFYGVVGGSFYYFLQNKIKKCVSNSVILQMLN